MKDWSAANTFSDLPCRKREVWEIIKQHSPLAYPEEQLEKFCHYVFGVDYAVIMGILENRKGSDKPCMKCESYLLNNTQPYRDDEDEGYTGGWFNCPVDLEEVRERLGVENERTVRDS